MKADLSGKTAFVTGAAGGIGRAIAKRLADCGAAIVVADIDGDGAERVAAELPRAIAVEMDIRDEAAVERGVGADGRAFGRLDILVTMPASTPSRTGSTSTASRPTSGGGSSASISTGFTSSARRRRSR